MADPYEALRLKNQLCFPLFLCAKEVTRRYEEFLQPLGLTYSQYVVMMYLWEQGSGNCKAMSHTLMLDPSTLTPLLKRLEDKGYLTRTRDRTDGRNLLVALTPEGEALKDRALSVPARMGACFALEPEEALELYRLTHKVLTNVTARNP